MEFGRITDTAKLDRIRFELPSLKSAEELSQLERLRRAGEKSPEPSQIFVGLPVWSEAGWVGNLYPPKTKSDHFLQEYAQQFSTVEINSTFYAVPALTTFQKWNEQVRAGFRFCPKFPQSISRSVGHQLNLSELERFIEGVRVLENHLGVCFLQLPPDFVIGMFPKLILLFAQFPSFLKTMVEFRHESFYAEGRLRQDVVEELARHRIGTVITDTAMYRNFVHASLSSARVLVRFAASNGHASDAGRIDQWVERLVVWFQNGMKEIYVTVHATEIISQIGAGRMFVQKLNAGLKAAGVEYAIAEPEFYEEAQGSLF